MLYALAYSGGRWCPSPKSNQSEMQAFLHQSRSIVLKLFLNIKRSLQTFVFKAHINHLSMPVYVHVQNVCFFVERRLTDIFGTWWEDKGDKPPEFLIRRQMADQLSLGQSCSVPKFLILDHEKVQRG